MDKVNRYRHYMYVSKWVERCIRSAETPAQIETARRLLVNYELHVNLVMAQSMPARFLPLCTTLVIGLRDFLNDKIYGSGK